MTSQFQKVRAIFNPKNLNTLRPELVKYIGKEFTFQYVWMMDDEDMFPNVWALMPVKPEGDFIYWTPEFDLEILE